MENLFQREVLEKFIERINMLTPQTQAKWGKMNVAQMLTHCQKPLQIASGELVPKVSPIIKFLFGKNAKKQLLNEPEFKKNSPTFGEAKILDKRIFDDEKNKLIKFLQNYQQKGEEGLTKEAHPFFGTMSVSDWNILQVKHLDHHLKQFGV